MNVKIENVKTFSSTNEEMSFHTSAFTKDKIFLKISVLWVTACALIVDPLQF
jgi:hypothetical protein